MRTLLLTAGLYFFSQPIHGAGKYLQVDYPASTAANQLQIAVTYTMWIPDDVARFRAVLEASGAWSQHRAGQARAALWSEIGDGLLAQFRAAPQVAARLAASERDVMAGTQTPADAARGLFKLFLTGAR